MCIRIGWGDYSLFDDVLRFGVSNVECSVSGKFYRRFPLVTMLHPPASDMTQSRSTSVCAAPCYPETELECSEEAKDELESSTVAKPSLCRYPSLSSPLFSDSSQEQHYALDFTEDESRLFPSWENPFLAQNASGAYVSLCACCNALRSFFVRFLVLQLNGESNVLKRRIFRKTSVMATMRKRRRNRLHFTHVTRRTGFRVFPKNFFVSFLIRSRVIIVAVCCTMSFSYSKAERQKRETICAERKCFVC